jgi:hypothetical protein
MRWLVIVTLLLGAHFALTAIAHGEAGRALFYWPFAKDSKPTLNVLGLATKPVTQLLSVIAGLCFLASVAALLGWLIPPAGLSPLMIVGSVASALLFLLYLGINALVPLAVDAFLLWGVFGWHWTVASLQGG